MSQLVLEIPDDLAERLRRLAARSNKSVEETAVEHLNASSAKTCEETDLAERYRRFFEESGLFEPRSESEAERYEALSDDELAELAARVGAAGPLSEVIIEERGER